MAIHTYKKERNLHSHHPHFYSEATQNYKGVKSVQNLLNLFGTLSVFTKISIWNQNMSLQFSIL